MPNAPSLPVVVERAYQLWLWLDAHVVNLPAVARASLGVRALDAALDLLDALLVAAYARRDDAEHGDALRDASRRVTFLRFLLRGMRDRRHLSLEQHAHAAAQLDVIGRMVGAWRRGPR